MGGVDNLRFAREGATRLGRTFHEGQSLPGKCLPNRRDLTAELEPAIDAHADPRRMLHRLPGRPDALQDALDAIESHMKGGGSQR